MMWSETYRPKRIEEMVGNEQARLDAAKWLSNWVPGTKALFLVGPPGTGKTTLARILASQFGYDLLEMNASDTRNKAGLQERIAPVFANTTNLLGSKLMLFLDEVDGISGREDSGGLDTLVELLKSPSVPAIMAANEKSDKVKGLAKVSKTLEFKPIPPRLLLLFLERVLRAERIDMGPGYKISSVTSSRGDVRAMLNSAQSRASGYATASKEAAELDIATAINAYFSADSEAVAVKFLARADAGFPDPRYQAMTAESRRRDLIAAMFSTIVSAKIDAPAVAQMLDVLSRADMIVGRAGKLRLWKLLKYVTASLGGRLYAVSRNKSIKYAMYSMPWPVMGPVFAKGQSVRRITASLSPVAGTSRSACGMVVLPYLLDILRNSRNIDLSEFCLASFSDETLAEPLSKLLERSPGKK